MSEVIRSFSISILSGSFISCSLIILSDSFSRDFVSAGIVPKLHVVHDFLLDVLEFIQFVSDFICKGLIPAQLVVLEYLRAVVELHER